MTNPERKKFKKSSLIALILAFLIPFLMFFINKSNQKEDIYFSIIEGADSYKSQYINNGLTSISLDDFEFDSDKRALSLGKKKITKENMKKLRSKIYMEYYEHEFNNKYKHRNDIDTFQFCNEMYDGEINGVFIRFYFNNKKELSIVEIGDKFEQEFYYYYDNKPLFHDYREKYDDSGFLDNHNYKFDKQISWILEDKVIERKSHYAFFSSYDVTVGGIYDFLFLDSKGLIEKFNYYFQLYEYLKTQDYFDCRSRYSEYKYGRYGFLNSLKRKLDSKKFEELNAYVTGDIDDFRYKASYDIEVDTNGKLNFIGKRPLRKEYEIPLHKKFVKLIDEEIERIVNLSGETDYNWSIAQSQCRSVANKKLLVVSVWTHVDNFYSGTPLKFKMMNTHIESDSSYFPHDYY